MLTERQISIIVERLVDKYNLNISEMVHFLYCMTYQIEIRDLVGEQDIATLFDAISLLNNEEDNGE